MSTTKSDPIKDNLKISPSSREKIESLARQVFGNKAVTKDMIYQLIAMDMATGISQMVVSASITRPTEEKFATNNYHGSITIDTSQIFATIKKILEDIPEDQMIDKYLEMKDMAFGLLSVKYNSSEQYIRNLLETAAARDNCPKTGRTAREE